MRMGLLKTFTLNWWQGGLFKLAMISLGIVMGLTWPDFFAQWRLVLLAVFILLGSYLACVWWRQ